MIEQASATLPFNCEQIFDLAADIEHYPDFMDGWISARILRRDGHSCDVDQVVGAGPVRLRFQSTAVMERPHRITITSTDAAFKSYEMVWTIAATPPSGCSISVSADIRLNSALLQTVLVRLLGVAVTHAIGAFGGRARMLYGDSVVADARGG